MYHQKHVLAEDDYSDVGVRQRSRTMLAQFDGKGVGFAREHVLRRPCASPGCRCKSYARKPPAIHKCDACHHAVTLHEDGKQLVLSPESGTIVDGRGNVLQKWLWERKRQGAGTPPDSPVILPLNSFWTLTYVDRYNVTLQFKCESIAWSLPVGCSHSPEHLARERRPLTVRITAASEAQASARAELQENLTTRGLGDMLKLVDDMQATVSRVHSRRLDKGALSATMGATLSGSALGRSLLATAAPTPAALREAAIVATAQEVPMFVPTASLAATQQFLSTGRLDTRTVLSPTATSAASTHAFAASADSFGAQSFRVSDGYGGMSGAAMHKGTWIAGADVLRKLQTVHPLMPRSDVLHHNSGKYVDDRPIVRMHEDLVFRPLQSVAPHQLAAALQHSARGGQLVLVACLRDAESWSRTTQQLLEHVNGTLATAFPDDPQFEHALSGDGSGSSGSSSDSGARASGRGRLCPYKLLRVDMAGGGADGHPQLKWVRSLPYFFMYMDGKLVYSGVMGGAGVVHSVSSSNMAPKLLLADPDPACQLQVDRAAKMRKVMCDTACGRFDAAAGRIVGTLDVAGDAVKRVAAHAAATRRGQASMREEVGGSAANANANANAKPAPPPGTDATARELGAYAIILVSADAGSVDDVSRLAATVSGLAPAASTASVTVGTTPVKLVGASLMVALHPAGSVYVHNVMCERCLRSIHKGPAAAAQALAAAAAAPAGPWTCPHCLIVQNATPDILLGGRCSVAALKPVKTSTVEQLTLLWRKLCAGVAPIGSGTDAVALLEAAGSDIYNARRAAARAPVVGSTRELLGGVTSDGAHVGLTHNDVLSRLAQGLATARGGSFLPPSFKPPVALSSSETVVRGVPLGR